MVKVNEEQAPIVGSKIPINLDDLLEKEFPPGHFVVGSGLLSANSVLYIAGPAKSYKSWVMKTMLLEIAGGLPIFGANKIGKHGEKLWTFPVDRPRRVLYLEQEIGEEDLKERFQMLLSNFTPEQRQIIGPNFFSYSTDHSLQLDRPEGVLEIAKVIEACQPEIVAFDPLVEFHAINENSSQEMMVVLRNIDQLREQLNFATLVCHHHGKSGAFEGRTGPDLMRGSSAIHGKGDSFMMIKFNAKEQKLQTEFTLRRGKGIPAMNLVLDPDTMLVKFHSWDGAGRPRDNSK